MRSTYTILTLVACLATGFAQANMSIVDEARHDAAFLSSGLNGDDCYALTIGGKTFTGEESEMTSSDMIELLGQRMTVSSEVGCPKAMNLTSVALEIAYADGRNMQYPETAMPNLTENPAVAERLLYEAIMVKFVNIKFTDSEGNALEVKDHSVALKG